MGKRPRSESDEENYGCLVKTDVSEKEVNLGVLQEQNMQQVYNKTMQMLFRGTRNLANNNAEVETMSEEDTTQSKDTVAYRQLSLNGFFKKKLS